MKYLLGSSFYENGKNGPEFRKAFSRTWVFNNLKADPQPSRVVVILEGGSEIGASGSNCDLIHLTGNLGHVGQLLSGEKKYEFSGWSASMAALAMLAYVDEADFLYKEEDCLAFGPWVKRMYEDMGTGDMVFGHRHTSPPWMPASQSLFLVRHSFIPKFVGTYLLMGKDGDLSNLGEQKFVNIERIFGKEKIKRLSFGVDRERPLPCNNEVWYGQQFTQNEMDNLKTKGLI